MNTIYELDSAITKAIVDVLGDKPNNEDMAILESIIRSKLALIEYERQCMIECHVDKIMAEKKDETRD